MPLRSKAGSSDIFYIDFQPWLCLHGLIFSWPEVDVKIHFLLSAIKLHPHPLTCHHLCEKPQARQSLHDLVSESWTVHIGTAFTIVSHVEATQAGGEMRESCCKSTLPTSMREFLCGSVLWFGDVCTLRLVEGKLFSLQTTQASKILRD